MTCVLLALYSSRVAKNTTGKKKRRSTVATREESGDAENEYIVYGPAGRLGIVLDNPDDNGPVVYVIKENSPLMDLMEVGDRLVAVDEVDVRRMTPTKASKLISKRSGNPMRKFTLVRRKSSSKAAAAEEETNGNSRDPPVA